jgi:uncharacterized protein (TIGR00290 family)
MVKKRAAALWTGGKDCSLALHEAKKAGFEVQELLTFAPPSPVFRAHPIPFLKRQAEAMGLPHRIVEIEGAIREGYERAMRALREEGIGVLVTGDIAEVEGQPNWVREVAKAGRLEVLTPLWGRERKEVLSSLLNSGFKAVFSLVKEPWFTREWVGRPIDACAVEDLVRLSRDGLDVCGENGEYHSLVLDGPTFKESLRIDAFEVRERDGMFYMDIREISGRKEGRAAQKVKSCARCGSEFGCGASEGLARCWCDEFPPIVPMSGEGCLCRNCLAVEVESLVSQRKTEDAGLCSSCGNARELKTKGAAILLCGAAATDKRLSKYPRLPMRDCPAHAPREA